MSPELKAGRLGLLEALSQEFSRALSRFNRDSAGVMLTVDPPQKLKQQAERVSILFEQGAPPAPPLQQRLQALARLRQGESGLQRRDWILITWGLCDDCGSYGRPIDEQPLFDAVMTYTQGWIERRDVPRKGWFGLLNSYFSYDLDESSVSRNWLRLRGCLVDTMPILIDSLRRPKVWSRMLDQHRDIFTDDAGRSMRQVVFYGSPEEHEQLNDGLPIPESSWLWRRLVAHQIEYLNGLDDAQFVRAIPAMVDFLRKKPLYADDLLAALLTRYCQSGQRDEPHELLKSESFSRWGNPQLRGTARWAKVQPPVRAMVLRWFAKADLEHFFSLLQGDGQVDQARLHYWRRFVDQMSYTRIVLGSDALANQHPEFRNFRAKNANRFSHLTGGASHNNAFIMGINGQYFVEFSGTGNACYAYHENELPFEPDAKVLHSSRDLKKKIGRSWDDTQNTISHHSRWEPKADDFLARRGIRPGNPASRSQVKVENYQPGFSTRRQAPAQVLSPAPAAAKPAPAAPVAATPVAAAPIVTPKPAAILPSAPSVNVIVETAMALASTYGTKVRNNLDKGGAFWVLTNNPGSPLGRKLTELGMRFNPGKGFWIQ